MKIAVVVVVLLAVVALLGAYAALRLPSVVKIARSRVMKAPAETIFPYLNNPRRVQEWNPFTEGDQALKMTYTGPAEGVGAQSAWDGNSGAGQATIIESEPLKRVGLRLDFKRPFNVTNYGEYSLKAQGSGTEVTWIINETALIPRVFSVFIDLEGMIGGQFEKGLVKLESLVVVPK